MTYDLSEFTRSERSVAMKAIRSFSCARHPRHHGKSITCGLKKNCDSNTRARLDVVVNEAIGKYRLEMYRRSQAMEPKISPAERCKIQRRRHQSRLAPLPAQA